MKTKSSLAAAIFFNISLLSAQSIISGKVIDSGGRSVPYATLQFYENVKDEKSLKAEKITDEKGSFQVQLPENGNYIVVTSAAGFGNLQKQYQFTADKKDLEIILLKEKVSNIQEVVIENKKQAIVRKLDRVVLNVADNPIAAGKSSLDLFKMAPGVFVNNGSISINGVWGTRVMVDGKMLNLTGDDLKNYLQNLRSNDIQSIEVIAHPSAEFDAEGSGGIINIITKRNNRLGWNGSIGYDQSFGIGKYPGFNPYASFNYKKGKFGFTSSYSYSNEKSYEELSQQRAFPNNGDYHNFSEDVSKTKSNRLKLGLNYDISPKQTLGIGYTGQFSNFDSSSNSNTQITYPNLSLNVSSKGKFPTNSDTKYHNVGLNYSLKTDSAGSKLTLLSDYTYNDRKGFSTTNSTSYDALGNLVDINIFRFRYPSIAKIFTADAKYNWIFKGGTSLMFGAKTTDTKIDNANSYENFDGANWQEDLTQNFSFLYKENVFAGYAELHGTLSKYEYQLGLRAENTKVNADLAGSQSGNVDQNYLSWFPSAFVKRNLDADGNNFLSLSYNCRIKRPGYFDLNPYKYYIDNYSVSTGNPYLKPQFTDAVEIGGMWKGKYYAAISYSYTKDAITQMIQTSNTSDLLTIIKANAGNVSVLTATFSVPVQVTKWWSTSNNLLLTYTKSQSPNFNIEKPSFVLQSEQEISLPKGYILSLNAFYTPQVVSGNTLTGAIGSVDLGFEKKFLSNKLITKVGISDIFYTNNFTAKSYFNNTVIDLKHKEQSRILTFSLIYNFSSGEKFKTQKIESSNAEEKGRL